MKKKFLTIWTVLLVAMLMTSTVSAGGAIGLSGSPGARSPLKLEGYLTGLGGYPDGVTIKLTGSGIPITLCTSPGGNEAPGQNPPKITVSGSESIDDPNIIKNGKAPVNVETENMVGTTLPGNQGGCPNNKWRATIVDIQWTDALVEVTNNTINATPHLLLRATYQCFARPDIGPSAYDCTLTDLFRDH